jgi:hypothetical protein
MNRTGPLTCMFLSGCYMYYQHTAVISGNA